MEKEDRDVPKFQPHGEKTTRAIRWKKWLRSFEFFMDSKGITDVRRKKSSLLHYAGPEVQDIFETLTVPNPAEGEQPDEYAVTVQMLTTKFAVSGNEPYESMKFRDMTPKESESVESFVIRLRQQAAVCGFVNAEVDRHIRDQIVVKCPHKELRLKMIDERDALTLDRAEEMWRAWEQSREESAAMDNLSIGEQVNKLKIADNFRRNSRNSFENRRYGKGGTKDVTCWKCGNSGHTQKYFKCPAKGKKCMNCGVIGHFAKVCHSKEKEKKRKVVRALNCESSSDCENSEKDENSEQFVFSVRAVHLHNDKDVSINCTVGNVGIPMIIDSGASCNVICKNEWERLKLTGIKCEHYFVDKKLFSYGESKPLKILGAFKAQVSVPNGNKLDKVEFFVFDGKGISLLGKDTAMKLGVLKIGLDVNNITDFKNQDCEDIIENFKDVFEGIGKLKGFQLKIPIKTEVKEVAQPVRRLPYNLRPHVEKLINELLQNDIIERVEGPTPWVSPVVITPKRENKWRLCVDMRVANQAIERERFPLPTIDEIIHELNGSKIFSKLDIKWAYHQLELCEESRSITTFCTPMGLFRYKRLMFGVNCGPEMYQRVITQTLQNCKGVCIYMDDLIVHGRDRKEHDNNLRKLLTVLREKGLTLNRPKCEFGLTELVFLNHHISKEGVKPTEVSQEKVRNFRQPKSAGEVRSFLGLVNFSAKFIPNLATIAEPLRKLTKKEEPFIWGTEQTDAFNVLKDKISNSPVLGFYDQKAQTRIYCDASPVGLGAVLVQFQEEGPKVVRYASKSLTSVEQRYSQTEKEALSLVWACETFHIYTFGKEFELVTDHKPLETIFGPHHKSCCRVERWVLRLMSYPYKIIYKPGKTNIADSLSRLLDLTKPSEEDEEKVKKEEKLIHNIVEVTVPIALSLEDMRAATTRDENLQNLIKSLKTNSWTKEQRNLEIFKDEFCEIDGLVLRGTRIVCPEELQTKCLELVHQGHMGMTAMKRLLRSKVWWNNMEKDVEQWVRTCHGCQLVAVADPPEPMSRTELPSEAWEYISMDHLGPLPTGEYLLVIVDYYSRFFEVIVTRSLSSQMLINQVTEMFARYGIPRYVMTDNGGTFIDKTFKKYLEENGCVHYHSTPIWPQANGQVERQNRSIMKRLRIAHATGKNWRKELQEFLFAYRTTPHSTTGIPPGELMHGRKVRSKLPDITKAMSYPLDEAVRDKDKIMKEKGRQYSDDYRRAKVCDLMPGDQVLMKQRKENKLSTNFKATPMTVVDRIGNAVTIQDPGGQTYKRNTSHVKQYFHPSNERSVPEEKKEVIERELSNAESDKTSKKVYQPDNDKLPNKTPTKPDDDKPPDKTPIKIPRERRKPVWHKDYIV